MFNNRLSGNAPNVPIKKPVIRRETVLVPVKKTPNPNGIRKPIHSSSPSSSATAPPASRFKLSERSGVKSKATIAVTKQKKKTPQAPAAQRAIAAHRGLKRKSTTPDRVIFSDDSEDSDDSDSDVSRKRMRPSESLLDNPAAGPKRRLVLDEVVGEAQAVDIVHGADCTSGTEEGKYTNPWDRDGFETVELQYPSNSRRERFELKWPKNQKEDYRPMEDIIQTITQIVQHCFPAALSAKYLDDDTGFVRRFTRMWKRESIPEFKAIVEEFNSVLTPLVRDGTIHKELAAKRHLPLEFVQRILDQIYSRTVSPKVESLRAYENGTDYVYGELLSRFCSSIFHQVKLTPDQVFVDLGSGVGNVVLQAALEVGCESWGIEYMKNPCDLADLQAKEFPGRTRLWGLQVGTVNLIRGDFTQNLQIAEVLRRADVVLVNNQAFTPALNDKLRDMFLDLKTGCKVVSLKPFVPDGHKISMRNIGSVENLFVQRKFEYFSKSVSWTDHEGSYYIATLDRRPLEKFMKENGPR